MRNTTAMYTPTTNVQRRIFTTSNLLPSDLLFISLFELWITNDRIVSAIGKLKNEAESEQWDATALASDC